MSQKNGKFSRCKECDRLYESERRSKKKNLYTLKKNYYLMQVADCLDQALKECSKCHSYLPLSSFDIDKRIGITASCKECRRARISAYGKTPAGKISAAKGQRKQRAKPENIVRHNEYQKQFQKTPKGYAIHKKAYAEYYQTDKCKDHITLRRRERRAMPGGKLEDNMRGEINRALNGTKNGKKWQRLVGYTLDDLIKHLEGQFTEGMNWGNYGLRGWHVDHIIPQSAFYYASPDDIDFKRCWGLDNLQPLWYTDNERKHAHITKPFQPVLELSLCKLPREIRDL